MANVVASQHTSRRHIEGHMERAINRATAARKPFRSLPRAGGIVGLRLADVAVDIAPAAIVTADEAAQFVQAMSAASDLISCDEFDFRVGLVLRDEAPDLQTQPAWRIGRVRVCVEIGRARLRRPCGAQKVACAEHIGAIARAHQFERRRCGLAAVDETATAKREPGWLRAAAKIRGSAAAGASGRSLRRQR